MQSSPSTSISSTNNPAVSHSISAPIQSYSSALVGHSTNYHVMSDEPAEQGQQIPNISMSSSDQENAMLTVSNPPDITAQVTNVLKVQASLPDVTAQAPTNASSTPNGDSGSSTPPAYLSTEDINSIDSSSFPKIIPVEVIHANNFQPPAMQSINRSSYDSLTSTLNLQTDSTTSCIFVDDSRDVAIVLNETAYNNSYNISDHGRHVDSLKEDNSNEQKDKVPAVTILGRGETPVADWSSRCDGLEFGGPINEDLLSMNFSTNSNLNQETMNYIEPHNSPYYQEIPVAEENSNMTIGEFCNDGNNVGVTYDTSQYTISNNSHPEIQLPLPDMDEAIVSFGECFEQATPLSSGVEPSSQLSPHNVNKNNELSNGPNQDQMRSDKNICYERYQKPGMPNIPGKKMDSVKYPAVASNQNGSGNVDIAKESIISDNLSEGSCSNAVPLNNETDKFSASNWAEEVDDQVNIEGEASTPVEEPASGMQDNLACKRKAEITEINNKVNYNYQEILSFVSNSWQQVEKQLTSGRKANYYYSNSKSNNKANTSIAKANNNLK